MDTTAITDNLTTLDTQLVNLASVITQLANAIQGMRDDMSQLTPLTERTADLVAKMQKVLDDASAALPAP